MCSVRDDSLSQISAKRSCGHSGRSTGRSSAYNFTNRNCSVAVALALECALMGSSTREALQNVAVAADEQGPWVAHFIRWKARKWSGLPA
jgi:hypothetical protein